MPEIQLGAHTIRSHGVKVARTHMHDWLILLLLIVIEVILNVIEPFHRFVGEDMMTDLNYPLKDNTVPVWAVAMIAIILPIFVIIVYYFIRRDVYDLHHAILGLLFSVLITGVITDAIKDAVGRPRPDFFWRCFPNGKGVFDPVIKDVMCTGLKSVIKEGHKSFPSGHTSWSFAGLGFLALYLSGKIRVFDQRGHVAKLCIVFLPLLIAALVGISRVDDYRHHWQDVFAGGLLGITVASFCYLQFFPAPYDVDVMFLRALFSTFITLWLFSPFYMTFWLPVSFDIIIHKLTLKYVVNRNLMSIKVMSLAALFKYCFFLSSLITFMHCWIEYFCVLFFLWTMSIFFSFFFFVSGGRTIRYHFPQLLDLVIRNRIFVSSSIMKKGENKEEK